MIDTQAKARNVPPGRTLTTTCAMGPLKRTSIIPSAVLLACAFSLPSCVTAVRQEPAYRPDRTYASHLQLSEYTSVQERPHQEKHLAVVVAVSGGGYRAAAFALGALLQMELFPLGDGSNLLEEIDYITTVSGGGFAAAALTNYFLRRPRIGTQLEAPPRSTLSFHDYLETSPDREILAENLEARLGQNLLNPTTWFDPTRADLLQDYIDKKLFTPPSRPKNDACWTDRMLSPAGTFSLGNVFAPQGAVPCAPYWIANATIYNNGQTVMFHPTDLRRFTSYWQNGRHYLNPSRKEQNSFYATIPLAVGMRASFSFPVVFPPVAFDAGHDKQKIYLIDGGTGDNLALFSALQILRHERIKSLQCQRRILIIIDAFNGSPSPYGQNKVPSELAVFIDSLSNYHSLAGHRLRTQTDLSNHDEKAFSIIEGAAREGDVAVFYLDLDEEQTARTTDTRLKPTDPGILELIEAGRNQVCKKIGGRTCPSTHPSSGVGFNRVAKLQARQTALESCQREVAALCTSLQMIRADLLDNAWLLNGYARRNQLSEVLHETTGVSEPIRIDELIAVNSILQRKVAESIKVSEEIDLESQMPNSVSLQSDAEPTANLDFVSAPTEPSNLLRCQKWAAKVVKHLTAARDEISADANGRDTRESASRRKLKLALHDSDKFSVECEHAEVRLWRKMLVTEGDLGAFDEAWSSANSRHDSYLRAKVAEQTIDNIKSLPALTRNEIRHRSALPVLESLKDAYRTCNELRRRISGFQGSAPASKEDYERELADLREVTGQVAAIGRQIEWNTNLDGSSGIKIAPYLGGNDIEGWRDDVNQARGNVEDQLNRLRQTLTSTQHLRDPTTRDKADLAEWARPRCGP